MSEDAKQVFVETQFYTNYARRPQFKRDWSAEKISKVNVVERLGYVSVKDRINQLIRSGRQLQLYRASQFDFNFEDGATLDDLNIDPTRHKNFDFAEAYMMLQQLNSRATLRKSVDKTTQNVTTDTVTKSDDSLKTDVNTPDSTTSGSEG